MTLADTFRWFPTPGYGVCGGADRSCVLQEYDPMDRLFYKHDNDLYAAHQVADKQEREVLEKKADSELAAGLRNLSNADMKKIPAWTWRWPFLKRGYAKLYRREAIKVFSNT